MGSKRRHRRKGIEAREAVAIAPPLIAPPLSAAIADSLENRPSVLPGAVVDGRYRLDRRISVGGMGEVWAGYDLRLLCEVAIKVLQASVASDREHRIRFRREATLLTHLRTERVTRVLDYLFDPSYGPVLVMELIPGSNLASLIAERRWTVEEAIDLGIELTSALFEVHRSRVIHRDIKPANIILTPEEDGTKRAVIIDFGCSRLVQEVADDDTALTAITGADSGLGTIQYMAPEQILGARQATYQSDIYGIGAVLFRAVSGNYVFPGLDGSELARAKLSLESPMLSTGRWDSLAYRFRRVVGRALERDPKERYATADEMRKDLIALRSSSQDGVASMRAPRGFGSFNALAVGAVCIALGVGGLVGSKWSKASEESRSGSASVAATASTDVLAVSPAASGSSAPDPLALSRTGPSR